MEAFTHFAEAALSAVSTNIAGHKRLWAVGAVLIVLGIAGYCALIAPPTNFPAGSIVGIARGASAPDTAAQLAREHIIAHAVVLRAVLRLSGQSMHVQAGSYLFETPQNVFTIAYRLAAGDYGLPPVRITFPEGETVHDDAIRIREALPMISATDFLAAAKKYEGYLFPDTYLFLSGADTVTVISTMQSNFDTKIKPLEDDITASGHSLSDVVTLASLVEKEARSSDVRRMVAGILWNRLKLGMPLQVDAVFGYIFDRDTYSPSYADLKVNSPYNTYTHTGLPPGPIGNPGFDSLDAAVHPTKTSYLYYLTGKDGQMHYATTYAQHVANQNKYLH